MTGEPTLDDVKGWLGLEAGDSYDDVVLSESLAAASAAIGMLIDYPVDDTFEPMLTDDIRNAVFVYTQRLAARRNSPEGVVGLSGIGGDFVSARVPAVDPDLLRLLGPYLKIPVA